MSERINFGKIKEGIEPPNLIEIQVDSYNQFLQSDVPLSKREHEGHQLQAVFKKVFPISSFDGKYTLDFLSYTLKEAPMTIRESMREGQTYSAPLYVEFALKDDRGTKREEVYMGEVPLMTPEGTFIINGAERVVVSQIHRSPGIAFESSTHPNGKQLYSFRIIPDRGSWLELQFDTNDLLYVYMDRRKRRRKFLATTLLRALGYSSDDEILKLFYVIQRLKLKDVDNIPPAELTKFVAVQDVKDGEALLIKAFEPLEIERLRQLKKLGVEGLP